MQMAVRTIAAKEKNVKCDTNIDADGKMIDVISRTSKTARRSITVTPNAMHSLFMTSPPAPSLNEFSRRGAGQELHASAQKPPPDVGGLRAAARGRLPAGRRPPLDARAATARAAGLP